MVREMLPGLALNIGIQRQSGGAELSNMDPAPRDTVLESVPVSGGSHRHTFSNSVFKEMLTV